MHTHMSTLAHTHTHTPKLAKLKLAKQPKDTHTHTRPGSLTRPGGQEGVAANLRNRMTGKGQRYSGILNASPAGDEGDGAETEET